MTTRTKTRRRPQLETLEGRALLATAGTLDPTFGTGGHVVTSFTNATDNASTVLLQPDGKIVAAGLGQTSPRTWGAARYNTNGTLDATFGSGGVARATLGGILVGAALDPDPAIPNAPKILEVGWVVGTPYRLQAVRFNNNGTLDTTFGGTGVVTAGSGSGSDALAGVAVQPDGKIVVGGDSTSGPGGYDEAFLLRYNPDGTLDPTFGNGGKVFTIYRPTTPQANSVILGLTLQPDGKIVTVGVAGQSSTTGSWATVARYNPDGSLDTSFGGSGIVFISQNASTAYGADSVAIQPDGKIDVAGQWPVGSSGRGFALSRLNADGTLDTQFGNGGMLGLNLGPGSIARGVAVQVSGGVLSGIVAVGSAYSLDSRVVRLDASGNFDSTFGNGGIVTDTSYTAYSVAVQPDGNILTSGASSSGATYSDLSVNRYLGSAQPVPQFVVTAQPPSSVTAGVTFGLTVEATDASGNLLSSYNGTVTAALASNPGGTALGGTLTATASNGFATFSNLWLNKAAGGYTLSVSGAGLAPATTTAIAVTPAAAAQLVFIDGPETVSRNTAFVVQAAISDAYGNVVTTAANSVTVSVAKNPGGSTLGGTTTMTAVNGYVTFSNLTLNRKGKGYLIRISSAGLTSTTTNPFNVS